MHLLKRTAMLLCIAALSSLALADGVTTPASDTFRVDLSAPQTTAISGRLLLFAVDAKSARAAAKNGKVDEVEFSPFSRQKGAVSAREITHLIPGKDQPFNADEVAYPSGFSQLPPGDYLMQAVLDVNHDYNYGGRGPGDVVSEVFEVTLPAAHLPTIKLVSTVPEDGDMWTVPKDAPAAIAARAKADGGKMKQATHAIDFVSPSLSAFWGRPVHMKGWVLTPPGYDAGSSKRYPVVYYTHGYGGNLRNLLRPAFGVYEDMKSGTMPPMIWVFLDESSATGTHEFTDSVNNGPWGHALTTELIPALDATYLTDGKASGRFLNGHSSGGWATLWLQTRYPKVFGGTWSTSPDPSDFHDFTGPDIYAAHANVYHRADGSLYPLMRDKGKVQATFESFAQMERVLGPYGGQLASFEWVFSPRGEDGRPQELFDRDTGDVDPAVAAYWHEHYDIANLVKSHWPTLKPDLDGKIHLYVGTADTFYLDGAAHKLKAVLDGLGAKSDFRFIPGKTHFDLYAKGDDRDFLLRDIAWQMYRSARPDSTLNPSAATH
ncbi:MAG: alpha/beta hydrolase-fold protein [Rhodanobacter sp.]